MSPSFALLGSGEFEDWHHEVDAWLLERATGDGSVLILPTASAPEGDEVFGRWASAGIAHYAGLGVPVEVLEVRTREDANRDELAERAGRASIVFVSGGNPSYAAATFAGSAVWGAVAAGLSDGRAYAGCSAGVACLTDPTYDTTASRLEDIWAPGLGFVPGVLFGPHWDIVDGWIPGARDAIAAAAEARKLVLVGIDERTAMVGDGERWAVHGEGAVHVRDGETWFHHPAGSTLSLTAMP